MNAKSLSPRRGSVLRRFGSWRRAGMAGILSFSMAGCSTLSPTPEDSPSLQTVARTSSSATEPQESTDVVRASAEEPGVSESPAEEKESTSETISTYKLTTFGEKQVIKESGPKPPTIPPPDNNRGIDLATAFRLAGIDNPTINLARERIEEALALRLGARALVLPSINLGGNYHAHFGVLQRASGAILDLDRSSFYFGAGARTVAAESVSIPGLRFFGHLGDVYFEPLVAQQRLNNRRALAGSVQNRVLLEVAEAYLNLLAVEAQLEVLHQAESELGEIVRLTEEWAKAGQGREGDAERAKSRADFLHQETEIAQGDLEIASVRLAALLSLDTAVRLHTPGGKIPTLQLVDEERDLEELLALALEKRPEIAAQTAEVFQARTRMRQEQVRPFLPTVSVGLSYGGFGGGSNLVTPRFGPIESRTDIDVFAVWTLQNLGVGNIALTKRASSVLGQAIDDLNRIRNEVRDQVSESVAQVQAANRQIVLARTAFVNSRDGFREEMLRIKQTSGRPIETLDTFRQWLEARQELVRTFMAYNTAQFRLYVAIGATPNPDIPPVVIDAPAALIDFTKP